MRLLLCLLPFAAAATACTGGNQSSSSATAPDPVSNVEVSKVTDSEVHLRWDLPAPAPERVVIDRNGTNLKSLAGTATEFTDTSVSPGTKYVYDVTATAASLDSKATRVTTKTGVPSVSEARIQGTYLMTFTLLSTNVTGPNPNVTKGRWRLTPICKEGPCDMKLQSISGNYKGRLAWLPSNRQRYRGAIQRRNYYLCGSTDIDAVEQILVNADNARVVDGIWLATRIRGQLVYDQNENGSCVPSAHEEVSLSGRLLK